MRNIQYQVLHSIFLDHMLIISTTLCLIAYSFYLLSLNDNRILYAFFFVFLGIVRYLYLVDRHNLGQSPESIMVKDPFIIITILGWTFYNTYFLYYP